MRDLIIYVILAAIGYFIGSKFRHKKEKLAWTGKFQTVAIVLLVLTMGSRMGANDEVIENLGSIGVYSLVVTVVILVFSIIAVFLARKVLRIDRWGMLVSTDVDNDSVTQEENSNAEGGKIDKMTLVIIGSVILGLICGFAFVDKIFDSYETFNTIAGHAIQIGLCILLSLVGNRKPCRCIYLRVDTSALRKRDAGGRCRLWLVLTRSGDNPGGRTCSGKCGCFHAQCNERNIRNHIYSASCQEDRLRGDHSTSRCSSYGCMPSNC